MIAGLRLDKCGWNACKLMLQLCVCNQAFRCSRLWRVESAGPGGCTRCSPLPRRPWWIRAQELRCISWRSTLIRTMNGMSGPCVERPYKWRICGNQRQVTAIGNRINLHFVNCCLWVCMGYIIGCWEGVWGEEGEIYWDICFLWKTGTCTAWCDSSSNEWN